MHPSARSPCPYLPEPEAVMSHRCLSEAQKDTPDFYFKALQYGHYLWLEGCAGRAILAVTRGLYADLAEDAPVLEEWPLPYRGLKWIVAHHVSDDFPGNPRISFQHQATRLRGARQDLRRARAWAVWALIRRARPGLPPDARDPVEEPGEAQIETMLRTVGQPNEFKIWRAAMEASDAGSDSYRESAGLDHQPPEASDS